MTGTVLSTTLQKTGQTFLVLGQHRKSVKRQDPRRALAEALRTSPLFHKQVQKQEKEEVGLAPDCQVEGEAKPVVVSGGLRWKNILVSQHQICSAHRLGGAKDVQRAKVAKTRAEKLSQALPKGVTVEKHKTESGKSVYLVGGTFKTTHVPSDNIDKKIAGLSIQKMVTGAVVDAVSDVQSTPDKKSVTISGVRFPKQAASDFHRMTYVLVGKDKNKIKVVPNPEKIEAQAREDFVAQLKTRISDNPNELLVLGPFLDQALSSRLFMETLTQKSGAQVRFGLANTRTGLTQTNNKAYVHVLQPDGQLAKETPQAIGGLTISLEVLPSGNFKVSYQWPMHLMTCSNGDGSGKQAIPGLNEQNFEALKAEGRAAFEIEREAAAKGKVQVRVLEPVQVTFQGGGFVPKKEK